MLLNFLEFYVLTFIPMTKPSALNLMYEKDKYVLLWVMLGLLVLNIDIVLNNTLSAFQVLSE